MCSWLRVCACADLCVCMRRHVCVYTCMPAFMQTCARAHTRMHVCVHTHVSDLNTYSGAVARVAQTGRSKPRIQGRLCWAHVCVSARMRASFRCVLPACVLAQYMYMCRRMQMSRHSSPTSVPETCSKTVFSIRPSAGTEVPAVSCPVVVQTCTRVCVCLCVCVRMAMYAWLRGCVSHLFVRVSLNTHLCVRIPRHVRPPALRSHIWDNKVCGNRA